MQQISDELKNFFTKYTREALEKREGEEKDEMLDELTEAINAEKPEDLDVAIENLFSECVETIRKKNGDYATDDDQFKSFRTVEMIGASVEQGILTRFLDKVSRLTTIFKQKRVGKEYVDDESFQDTIKDAINYLAILHVYIEQEADR